MSERILHKRVLRWGNSYGIRLTKKELEDMAEGQEVEVTVRPARRKIDWSKITGFGLPPDSSVRHDEYAYQGWLAQQKGDNADPRRPSRAPRR